MPFVDTSALYSLMDRSDRNHERTRDLLESAGEIVLTDHILVEAHRLAAHRLGRMVADSFWSEVMAGSLTLEPVRLSDLEEAHEIRMSWTDQDFSLVDCTSFAVMERLRLTSVVALDDDFSVYRYGTRRQHSFEVLR